MDADKEGFLRNERSLVQTIGRAARNERGRVILYADKITDSMRRAIDETHRRRIIQAEYNKTHNITPYTIKKSKEAIMLQTNMADRNKTAKTYYLEPDQPNLAADPVVAYMSAEELEKQIQQTQKAMQKAAKELDFIEAARMRDEVQALQQLLKTKR
jgi:excinuclease ABC subunit B